jgi:hypothetical protein
VRRRSCRRAPGETERAAQWDRSATQAEVLLRGSTQDAPRGERAFLHALEVRTTTGATAGNPSGDSVLVLRSARPDLPPTRHAFTRGQMIDILERRGLQLSLPHSLSAIVLPRSCS